MNLAATRPWCVGLSGGVASGKSTVARRFEALGVAILDADAAAREVLAAHTPGLKAVVAEFGNRVLNPQGSLDRSTLRVQVFTDPVARQRLESIVHPQVRAWFQQHLKNIQACYAMLVIPLLVETWPAYQWLDRVLVVDVSPVIQRARLIQRDGIAADLAEYMIAAQADRQARLQRADDVIDNGGIHQDLDTAVAALHTRYQELASGQA